MLYRKQTIFAYTLVRILDTPFWGLYNLLIFILYKDLAATPLQLSVMISLKPLVSLFSSYWSHHAVKKWNYLSQSILCARFIAFIPFLLFPLIENTWIIISCAALFMFLQVGMTPAWMELLHKNLPQHERNTLFSYTQAFGYLGGGLFPFIIGWALDEWTSLWHWLFAAFALISLIAQFWIPQIKTPNSLNSEHVTHSLLQPWKNAWTLLWKRPDFAKFQIGFMLLGSGLMIIQPALPAFFVDKLKLSFTDMGIAITLCKGITFAALSPVWTYWIRKVDLFRFSALMALLATLFPLCLIFALNQAAWLFIAYLIYGGMQSGNELCWNVSGPSFASSENSCPYSNVNIIAVGIRGLIVPSIGAILLTYSGSTSVIYTSCALCVFASILLYFFSPSSKMIPSNSYNERDSKIGI